MLRFEFAGENKIVDVDDCILNLMWSTVYDKLQVIFRDVAGVCWGLQLSVAQSENLQGIDLSLPPPPPNAQTFIIY